VKLYVFRNFRGEWGGMLCAVAENEKEAIAFLRNKDDLLEHSMPSDDDFGVCEVFEIKHGLTFSEWCGH
jgi:hypothetical protein